MTAREVFPDSSLTLEQWQLVKELSKSLTAAQARWASGYFAGLDAGLLRLSETEPPTALPARADARTLSILYGSETGNSSTLAKSLAEALRDRGLAPEIFDMANYKPRRLKDEQDLLVLVSTHGEGDPPQPVVGFFEYVEGNRAPRLEGLRFAVLALGDSTYERYCEAGKRLDLRFEELGGKRLHPRIDCDVDYEESAAAWNMALVDLIAEESGNLSAAATASPVVFQAASVYDKRNPFPATILENILIVGRHSSKETRHIEFDIAGSGLVYEPGDALGIAATNDPVVVAELLDAVGTAPDASVTVKGETILLASALEQRFEVATATPRFLDQWAKLTGARLLQDLCGEARAADRAAFLHAHHVVDIVRGFPLSGIAPEELLAGLRQLQPRLYSLASSLAAAPDEAHVTLSPVRYDLDGTHRNGVASGHLADRGAPGSSLPVYVQSNPHFRLPADEVPIIMIGAGTGVAPYRAFLQEREARGADGRAWLFFGDRNFRSDFLYQAEWQDHLKAGLLTRMDVAFSRDTARKDYVQHRLIERSAELFAWLEEGAHLYVCGDAVNMAPDVNEALVTIIEREAAIDREAAEEYVRRLVGEHRYQRDVY